MTRFVTAALLFFLALSASAAPQGYYRFPALAPGDRVIFTAEGDLWIASIADGAARRLTSNLGTESNAAVSPDGKTLAFSAQYEGPTEVYTMPVEGGLPVRRTFDGENATVIGWTPSGKIIYATGHFSTLPCRQLVTLDPATGAAELVPLSQASDGTFDEAGTTLYFTRLPFQGSQTKRYAGGTAQNIWKYANGAPEATPLTADYAGTSKSPMWWQGKIYFASDRDGTMNLWSMDPSGGALTQLTHHKGWDVKSPSLRDGRIVYQAGADLYLYDILSSADRIIPVTLSSDFDQTREKWVTKPVEYVTAMSLSPSGDRVAFTARGQVFIAPAQDGRLVRATTRSSVRYRDAHFMPDGKSLLALSDETGELEYWKLPANGVGEPVRITHDGAAFRYEGHPSPDGKMIAYGDKRTRLWIFDGTREILVDSSESNDFNDIRWSPDGKWLAYTYGMPNSYAVLRIFRPLDGKKVTLTSDRVDSYQPTWSPDGKWLYFLSDRYFHTVVSSPWGSRQPEPYYDKTTKIYAFSLRKEFRSPWLPPDELSPSGEEKKEEKKADNKEEKKDDKKKADVVIDLDGLEGRVIEVPVGAGNYGNLAMNEKFLFWTESDGAANPKFKLVALEIKNRDIASKTLLEEVTGGELSADGKKILARKGDDFYVIDASATPPSELGKAKINLSAWNFPIVPRDEWRQMFTDAWRLERDFFYAPNLHGVDYKGLLAKHQVLVDRVTDRDELNDLIADLVGELSALHIFVFGGDRRTLPEPVSAASLGAVLARDDARGGWRITHIYKSDPDYPDALPPLRAPGLAIAEGDVITAVNGITALSVASPSLLLRNQAKQQVLLHIKPASGKEYDAVVKPISMGDEANLRYGEWELTRRLRVDEEGKGEIGYVHLRAMGGGNYDEWTRNFYPVFDRKGLIIDVRNNSGGNIDSWILEKLLRKAWFYWQPRTGAPTWNMQYAFRGHLVVICNERTASDGEAFTEGFRRLGLGKVIGTRTWGGEVWLSFDNPLMDKGLASAAETGVYGPEGKWLIEGHGVDPDIVVDNLPHATFGGADAQLDAAISYLRKEIQDHPITLPPAPPYPNKALDYK